MTPRTLLAAAIGGSILLGCAYPWPEVRTAQNCTGQHCEVAVSATPHDTPFFGCFVEKSVPDQLHVKHPRPVTIDWYLDLGSVNDGYRFPDDGIVFANPNGWDCKKLADGQRFQCINKAGPGAHKYTVNAVRGSSRCDPLDPWIIND